jgi:tetratricopeptide (TPR) repeat protein
LAWQSRPVFISSTFLDMQAERDYLRTHVFPELEERLRARRCHLEWVDLRLGVATASYRDAQLRELLILKVCLGEVRRCRPFLIGLLGDRYGWALPPDRIRAAAVEEGFSGDLAGRSLTDLEINFGVLSAPQQQPRSFFYFREPLPYMHMPAGTAALYSDAYDADPVAAERVKRLAVLKRRIEQALPGHVRHYAVEWNAEHQRIGGLERWGRMVLEDVWSALEAESSTADAEAEIPWQQSERDALDDFVEDCGRDFVGRQGILSRLVELAAPARGTVRYEAKSTEQGDLPDSKYGLCITGPPGSGKSALFGELRRWLKQSDALVLAHAAGASTQSTSVDSMLRRWIGELADAIGIDTELPENADPETAETAFSSLLGRAAAKQRVVVLVDALDQFEATTRARFVTWLPRLWPENARFIATAVTGDASNTLGERLGLEVLPLRPLDATEARAIIEGICNRYHRKFESEVIDALLAKTGADGPAWGNPLWLVLAVEELNLLDTDDFARAQRTYPGTPGEQLRSLMLDIIATLPANIPDLYGHMFKRAEELFGAGLTWAFLGSIAISRAGWREIDFRILLPRISGEHWDELKFAYLRRFFRGQLRQRGALAQWDFNHAQMRMAARERLSSQNIAEKDFHKLIVDHLLSCHSNDPLRVSETMFHLLGSEDWVRAARHYGDLSISEAELQSATRAVADTILGTHIGNPSTAARDLCHCLLETPNLDNAIQASVAERLFFNLEEEVSSRGGALGSQLVIADRAKELFKGLLRCDPSNRKLQRNFASAQLAIGVNFLTQGKLDEAFEPCRDSVAMIEHLAAGDGGNTELSFLLSKSHQVVGEVLKRQGKFDDALQAYRDSIAIAESLPNTGNIVTRLNLSEVYNGLGEVLFVLGRLDEASKAYRSGLSTIESLAAAYSNNDKFQRNLSASYIRLGDVFRAQGKLEDALKTSRQGLGVADRLAAANPRSVLWQGQLSDSYQIVGDVLVAQGNLDEALEAYRASLSVIERLAALDVSNTSWQYDLSRYYTKVGDLLLAQIRQDEALQAYRHGLSTFEHLAIANPSNTDWQRALAGIYNGIGNILLNQGKLGEALTAYQDSLAIWKRIARADPDKIQWQRDLAVAYSKVGDVLSPKGNLEEALEAYGDSVAIMERVAAADRRNPTWQTELGILYKKVGDALMKQDRSELALKAYAKPQCQDVLAALSIKEGDVQVGRGNLQDAFTRYRHGLTIMESLAAADPSNIQWQHGLATAYSKLGDVQLARGNLEEALTTYRNSLTKMVHVADADPKNMQAQRDLAMALGQVAMVHVRLGRIADALRTLRSGRAIMAELVSRAPGYAQWKNDLAMFDRDIAGLNGST